MLLWYHINLYLRVVSRQNHTRVNLPLQNIEIPNQCTRKQFFCLRAWVAATKIPAKDCRHNKTHNFEISDYTILFFFDARHCVNAWVPMIFFPAW